MGTVSSPPTFNLQSSNNFHSFYSPRSNNSPRPSKRQLEQPDSGKADSPVIFKFKEAPPNQIEFANHLKQKFANDIARITPLRSREGYLVYATTNDAANRLHKAPATTFEEKQFAAHIPKPRTTTGCFVVTGVPLDLTTPAIHEELTARNGISSITNSFRITSQKTNKPTTLIRVFCSTDHAAQAVKQGVKIGFIHHRCEEANRKPEVSQCFKCQKFGHISRECQEDTRCVRCSEGHPLKECRKQKDEAKCINCGQNHPALYKGCPAYKKAQETEAASSQQSYATKAKKTEYIHKRDVILFVADIITKLRTNLHNSTYSQVLDIISASANTTINVPVQGNHIHDALQATKAKANTETPEL